MAFKESHKPAAVVLMLELVKRSVFWAGRRGGMFVLTDMVCGVVLSLD